MIEQALAAMVREANELGMGYPEHAKKRLANPIALKAIFPERGARTVFAMNDCGDCVGVASFRITPEGTKIINIFSLHQRRGVGTALVDSIRARAVGPLWCQSTPEAKPFYASLGMVAGETLEDGRTIFRMPP